MMKTVKLCLISAYRGREITGGLATVFFEERNEKKCVVAKWNKKINKCSWLVSLLCKQFNIQVPDWIFI